MYVCWRATNYDASVIGQDRQSTGRARLFGCFAALGYHAQLNEEIVDAPERPVRDMRVVTDDSRDTAINHLGAVHSLEIAEHKGQHLLGLRELW